MSTVDALRVRLVLGRKEWCAPTPFGPDGWRLVRQDGSGSVIVSAAEFDGAEWVHASIAFADHLPTYDDLKLLHLAVFGDGYSHQLFVPIADHVNIHDYALHLWGRADGTRILPDFGAGGSI